MYAMIRYLTCIWMLSNRYIFFGRNVNFRPTSRVLHAIHALVSPVSLPESRDAVWSRFACNWIL